MHEMKIGNALYIADRPAWRAWLKQNYQVAAEVWLVYYRKQAALPRIAYNDALEEALCFGWIDSTVKDLDVERFVQRFSPRSRRSGYSQPNKERLRRLIEAGKISPDVLPNATGRVERGIRDLTRYLGSYKIK